MKKKKRKWIIIAVVVLIIIVAIIIILNCNNTSQGTPVEVSEITRMDIEQTVDVKGTVEGTDTAEVYSGSQRRISEILIKEGDRVKNGDNLAKLEDETSSVNLEKAQLELDTAKRKYENYKVLYGSGAISLEEYLVAEETLKDAELTVRQLEEDRGLFVTSPIDGTVTRIYASVGKIAGGTSAESLFRIENIDQLQMKLKISEYDISKVHVGQEVRITSNVIGKSVVSGNVVSMAPTGEEKTPGSNNMVVPVTVNVDKNQTELFAGINAKASIITGEATDVLTVPIDSVIDDVETGERYIFIVSDNIAHKIIITPVLENEFYLGIEDNSDIKEGDMVVLSPDYSITEGMIVQEISK